MVKGSSEAMPPSSSCPLPSGRVPELALLVVVAEKDVRVGHPRPGRPGAIGCIVLVMNVVSRGRCFLRRRLDRDCQDECGDDGNAHGATDRFLPRKGGAGVRGRKSKCQGKFQTASLRVQ
jgi:hypothetical protein